MMKKTILPMLIFLFITGCSPMVNKYHVEIEAMSSPDFKTVPKSYTIKALGKDTDEKSLKFQKQAFVLDELLQKEGYKKAENENLAQQIIFFDYGIEKVLEEVENYSEPRVTMGVSVGNGYGRHYSPFWNEFGYYRSYQRKYTYYNRYVTILSKEKTGKELWHIDVSSIGESKNLRKIVPLLLKSAVPYIGKDTQEPVKIVIKEKKSKEE